MANSYQELSRGFSAQGSITVQRLRNGDGIFITFANLSGKPLYQSIDTDNGNTVSPDWSGDSNDVNRPIIQPQVKSTTGEKVIISQAVWKYNGSTLSFVDVPTSETWAVEDSAKPRFAFRASDFAIKPIDNLVSPTTQINGTLSFSCIANANGGTFSVSDDQIIVLAKGGASSFYGFITASSLTLDNENPTTVLTSSLYCGGNEVPSYFIKWYKDRDHLTAHDGQNTIEVSRGNVDSTQLFIAEFYQAAGDAKPVAYAGITVVDTADEFRVSFEYLSANQYLDNANPSVELKAHLVSSSTGAFMTQNIRWMLDVIDKETFKSIKSSNTDTIEVTTAETDRKRIIDGKEVLVCSDVDVLAEAQWGLNFSVAPSDLPMVVPYWRDMNYVKGQASFPADRVTIQFDI